MGHLPEQLGEGRQRLLISIAKVVIEVFYNLYGQLLVKRVAIGIFLVLLATGDADAERRRNWGLVIAGASTVAVAYAVPLAFGISAETSYQSHGTPANAWVVGLPIVGASIYGVRYANYFTAHDREYTAGNALIAVSIANLVVQAAGAGLFTAGMIGRREPAEYAFRLVPYLDRGGGGIAGAGTF